MLEDKRDLLVKLDNGDVEMWVSTVILVIRMNDDVLLSSCHHSFTSVLSIQVMVANKRPHFSYILNTVCRSDNSPIVNDRPTTREITSNTLGN